MPLTSDADADADGESRRSARRRAPARRRRRPGSRRTTITRTVRQRIGGGAPDEEHAVEHDRREQRRRANAIVLEQRNHQHAGSDQRRRRCSATTRPFTSGSGGPGLHSTSDGHQADHEGQRQREPVGDQDGQAEADRQSQNRLVARGSWRPISRGRRASSSGGCRRRRASSSAGLSPVYTSTSAWPPMRTPRRPLGARRDRTRSPPGSAAPGAASRGCSRSSAACPAATACPEPTPLPTLRTRPFSTSAGHHVENDRGLVAGLDVAEVVLGHVGADPQVVDRRSASSPARRPARSGRRRSAGR